MTGNDIHHVDPPPKKNMSCRKAEGAAMIVEEGEKGHHQWLMCHPCHESMLVRIEPGNTHTTPHVHESLS